MSTDTTIENVTFMEGILEGILKTTLNVSKTYINSGNTLDYMQINK